MDRTIVATDDDRIVEAVRSFQGEVRLTRSDHPSGTDRVAEVVAALDGAEDDLVLNVQGDEPEIAPGILDDLIERMTAGGEGCRIGTLAAPFDDDGPCSGPGSPLDPNCVKVVANAAGEALYFSRSPVPYPCETGGQVDKPSRWLLHLGVYAFRAGTLRELTSAEGLAPSPLEMTEALEQLRWLEHGFSIAVVRAAHRFIGIDTPQDYAAFVSRIARGTKSVRPDS